LKFSKFKSKEKKFFGFFLLKNKDKIKIKNPKKKLKYFLSSFKAFLSKISKK